MTVCACGEEHEPDRNFYISAIDGQRYSLLLGPFPDHPIALEWVKRATDWLNEWDTSGQAWFYAYGTCSTKAIKPCGRLNAIFNKRFGLELPIDDGCWPA
jgi:hypothetical protein